jgi:hypothetical protein
MSEPMETPIYEEVQEPVIPVKALTAGLGATSAWAAAAALGLGLRLGVAGVVGAGVGLLMSEFLTPMRTTLLASELQVCFGRRTRFRIPLRNVVSAYPRSYNALREFGGWGIRWGRDGRAFNMRGGLGVQLVLKSGQKVLIGSQRPEELAAHLRRLVGGEE